MKFWMIQRGRVIVLSDLVISWKASEEVRRESDHATFHDRFRGSRLQCSFVFCRDLIGYRTGAADCIVHSASIISTSNRIRCSLMREREKKWIFCSNCKLVLLRIRGKAIKCRPCIAPCLSMRHVSCSANFSMPIHWIFLACTPSANQADSEESAWLTLGVQKNTHFFWSWTKDCVN